MQALKNTSYRFLEGLIRVGVSTGLSVGGRVDGRIKRTAK